MSDDILTPGGRPALITGAGQGGAARSPCIWPAMAAPVWW